MNASRREFAKLFALSAAGFGAFRFSRAFAAALPRPFVIAHISDVHCSVPEKADFIRRIVAEVNADPLVDLVVVSGDLQNRSQLSELELAKSWYDAITKPKIVAPGNHELQYEGAPERWAKVFGEKYRSMRCGEIPVYAVDSCPPGFQTAGHFKPGEMARLVADMKRDHAADAPFAIVVTHYSPNPRELVNWFELPKAIREAGVRNALVLSGHIHRFMAWNWSGVLGFAGRAVGQNKAHKDYPPGGYIRVTVSPDGSATAEEKIVGANAYAPEFKSDFAGRGVKPVRFKPVPPPAGAFDVVETGRFEIPPPALSPSQAKALRAMGKHFREKLKDMRFGVSSSCALLEKDGRVFVPGNSGVVRVVDAATRKKIIRDVVCGYSPVTGLAVVAGGIRVSLAEGRSFTMNVDGIGL